ncbi:uncharacterized protein [Argopecten irradians]|uniref:uncharacterized protein n=1 Tax=Argopecten irradians TaxID=31199 RepID=UPI003722173F
MNSLGDHRGSSPERRSPRLRSEFKSPVRYVPNRITDHLLGHGIRVRYPCKYRERPSIKSMVSTPVIQGHNSRLQTEYDSLCLRPHEIILGNIYDICLETDSRTGAFRFNPEDLDDVIVGVNLNELNLLHDNQSYMANVKVGSQWKRIPASHKSGVVTFHAVQIDTFCVSCMPFVEAFDVLPTGGSFKSKENPNVEIRFPRNSVKTKEKIDIQIVPVDMSQINDENESAPSILALSDCVQVRHSKKFKLSKPVRLSLDLVVPKGAWTGEYDIIGLHWKEEDEIVIESLTNADIVPTPKGYNITYDVTEFTGRQLSLVNKKAQPRFIKSSVRVAAGDKVRCQILVFTAAANDRTRTLRFECVHLKRVNEIVAVCESEYDLTELKQCRSTEIRVSVGDRIRVDIGGCGRVQRAIPKEHTFIPFFGAMSDNHISLPIDINGAFGQSIFVLLNFTLISRTKTAIHSTHFDPQMAGKKPRRRRSRSPYYSHVGDVEDSNYGLANRRSNCPYIAIREPTPNPSELISNASINIITLADSQWTSPPTSPIVPTPDSSRATSAGTRVMITSGINRQSSLEVLLNQLDDSIALERATPKFGNEVFGDRSLYKLATRVSPHHTLGLTVHLGLDTTNVEHVLQQNQNNSVAANFRILTGWLGLETGSPEDALQVLCNALEEIDYHDLKDELQIAFRENRSI